MHELAAAIRSLASWTKSTIGDLEERFRGATSRDAIRVAFARRLNDHRPEF
jgi:hypothetical protein